MHVQRFTGQVVIVTGAARGIGRASAERFAAEGASVALLDLRAETLEETTRQLREAGRRAVSWVVDMAEPAAVGETVSSVLERFGRVDVLHSNAGIVLAGSALTQTVDEWDRIFAVNVRSMFLAARAVIPGMQAQGRGAIVLTSSVSGLVGDPDRCAYGPSKGAIISMTKQLAVEYARDGIRVNCMCPGWVDTEFSAHTRTNATAEEIRAAVDATVPVGRQGSPEEIAAVAAFLASEDAAYVTGHALVVDGGLTAI